MTQPARSGHEFSWAMETMRMINKMTPDIQGKAFDPDWFLLRNRLEEFERAHVASVAQAAQPDSAAKPAEDGLEAQTKEVLALAWARFNEPLWKARADMEEILRTHQAAREKEIRTCPVHGKSKQFCTDCATQLEQQASGARERDALVKFIGSQARAAEERERELREKLEGLRDDCDEKETSLRNLGEPEIADEVQRHTEQLNALLASHWPAQKEIE
jgi:hypothetical protein